MKKIKPVKDLMLEIKKKRTTNKNEDVVQTKEDCVKKFRQCIEDFRKMIGADEIIYTDLGKGETYVISKGNMVATLDIGGNMFDGGYMNIDVKTKD